MEGFFHLCSDGLDSGLLYRDQLDFIDGMNDIPICLVRTRLKLLAFCLMCNHFHFVIYGTYEDCENFYKNMKRRISFRLKRRYHDVDTTSKMNVFIGQIDNVEYLRNAIIYTLRNPFSAKMNYVFHNYPYSSANLYFTSDFYQRHFVPLSTFSNRDFRERLNTGAPLPPEWLINLNSNLIYPGSYTQVEYVERLFETAIKFTFEVMKNNDSAFEQQQGMFNKASYDPEQIMSFVNVICDEVFKGKEFNQLDYEQRITLARLLYRRHHVSAKQFARISKLPLYILDKVMK